MSNLGIADLLRPSDIIDPLKDWTPSSNHTSYGQGPLIFPPQYILFCVAKDSFKDESGRLNLPKGQERQLELYLADLAHHVLAGQP